MQPQIDIALVASPFCFLNKDREFHLYLKYKLHHHESITFNPSGSIFDPAATFAGHRIEIQDTVTKEVVPFRAVSRSSVRENQDDSLILRPEVESYFFWTTSTQPPQWREHSFDTSGLTPRRTYTMTYRNHGISHWYSGSHPMLEEMQSNSTEVQSGDLIQVNLIGDAHPHFTTRQAVRPPPPVSASLATSLPTCSLSGTPAFTVSLTWKLLDDRPISALITRAEGRNIGLEIRDPEKNGRRIGPPPDWPQGDEDNVPPGNDKHVFVALTGSTVDFSETYTLDTKERQGGLAHSDTWNLKDGKMYELTLRKHMWRWVYQDEIEGPQGEATVIGILRQEPWSEWKPDCRAEFRAQ